MPKLYDGGNQPVQNEPSQDETVPFNEETPVFGSDEEAADRPSEPVETDTTTLYDHYVFEGGTREDVPEDAEPKE